MWIWLKTKITKKAYRWKNLPPRTRKKWWPPKPRFSDIWDYHGENWTLFCIALDVNDWVAQTIIIEKPKAILLVLSRLLKEDATTWNGVINISLTAFRAPESPSYYTIECSFQDIVSITKRKRKKAINIADKERKGIRKRNWQWWSILNPNNPSTVYKRFRTAVKCFSCKPVHTSVNWKITFVPEKIFLSLETATHVLPFLNLSCWYQDLRF